MARLLWLSLALLHIPFFSPQCLAQSPGKLNSKKPNIIFILTDDQDLHMDSLSYMPHLRNRMSSQGTTFSNHYCTVALCCPSRVSLWTGKAAHNTNVTDVNPPYGGYPKFISQGFNDAYLPVWLQEGGYDTYYVGKLFNAHTVENFASPHAQGWTGSEFLLDPFTYEYLNATFSRDGMEPVSYEGQYSTDLVKEKAFGFLDDAVNQRGKEERPFFLTIAPIAPHSNVHMNTRIDGNFSEGSNTQSPPVAAARHAHLFENVTVPRTPHFNPENPHGVSWISRLPRQNESNIAFNDHFYQQRLRALQAVDEMIDELFVRLEDAEILEETYVFYSTDNGYHIGQHRLQPGKQCAFEEDVNIPFIARGPGIPKDQTRDLVSSHTDLAPTFLELAGIPLRDDFDGQVISLHEEGSESAEERWRTEHVNIESWGIIMSEGDHGQVLYPNHTYKALRIIAPGYSLLYTVWCSGEHELYDLVKDPYQMENLFSAKDFAASRIALSADKGSQEDGDVEEAPLYRSEQVPMNLLSPATMEEDMRDRGDKNTDWSPTLARATAAHLLPRLDALLMVLKTCKGRACTHPWEILHPAGHGRVRNLLEAMDPKYDTFYAQQEKVAYEKCEKGYILESEGPMRVSPYSFDVGA